LAGLQLGLDLAMWLLANQLVESVHTDSVLSESCCLDRGCGAALGCTNSASSLQT
jgi:hypothetical protein